MLRFSHSLPQIEQAALLEARSYECYLTGNLDDAIADQSHALTIREATGDRLRIGDNLRWLSRFCWFAGRNAEAEHHAQAALDTLEALPASHELAMAYSNLSQLRMLAYETTEAIRLGRCAIAHATAVNGQATLVHAHINVGTAMIMSCDPQGRNVLERSIRIGKALLLDDDVARGLANLAWTATDHYELDLAERTLAEGVAFTSERDLVAMERYLRAVQARVQLARGDWQAAGRDARSITRLSGATRLTKIVTLTVEGRVAARTGADASPMLDEALALAQPTGEFMRLGPLRAARAEAAWLAGDSTLACAEIDAVYAQAVASGECWLVGELALWLHRGGRVITDTSNLAEPFALEITGAGFAAASIWSTLGCPLEEARALASTNEETHLLRALAIADQLGAKPDLARITRLLRGAGVATIPRGPRPETRSNPALLTARELDVVELLVQGHSNREIADVLFLSPRTVGHHVSAILSKLEVDSRLQVPTRMCELEMDQHRSPAIPI